MDFIFFLTSTTGPIDGWRNPRPHNTKEVERHEAGALQHAIQTLKGGGRNREKETER